MTYSKEDKSDKFFKEIYMTSLKPACVGENRKKLFELYNSLDADEDRMLFVEALIESLCYVQLERVHILKTHYNL